MLTELFLKLLFLVIFGIFSYFDLKNKELPSIFTSGFIIFLLILFGVNGLISGLFTVVFSFFMLESDFFKGLADAKLLTAFGIILPFGWVLYSFLVIFMFYGIIWKIISKKILKIKDYTPFVIVIFFTYLTYLLINLKNII